MAKAFFEKRSFMNEKTGEVIKYEVYGIVSNVEGERMELAFKNLSPAEKIAFKMLLTGTDNNLEVALGNTTDEDLTKFNDNISHSTDSESDDWLGKLEK